MGCGIPNEPSAAQREQIDKLADRFEIAFGGASCPLIEDYLAEHPELHPHLLRELLTLEVQLRRRQEQTPDADDYRRRFPEAKEWIAELFKLDVTEAGGVVADSRESTQKVAEKEKIPRHRETGPMSRCVSLHHALAKASRNSFGFSWKRFEIFP